MGLIMSWGKCSIKIGKTLAADAIATTLTSVGSIKDKSASMEQSEGEKKEAKSTGGVLVGFQLGEPTTTVKCRIIEPDYAMLATLIGATHDTQAGSLKVTSTVIADPYSVVIEPQNIGGTGLKIRKASVEYKEGWSEDEGSYADFTFTVLACADGELYTKVKKTA